MKQLKMRIEEYYPAGQFLRVSFFRDRPQLVVRFSDFTAVFLENFDAKLLEVKLLEQSVVLTEQQKGATKALYLAADAMNTELNFLKFQMGQAGLNTALVTLIKKNINTHNIEGACQKLVGLNQFIVENHLLLESKGMAASFPADLAHDTVALEAKNVTQNEVMNVLKQLHEDNSEVYKALYRFISTIAAAGKVMYKGKVKEDEYTITRILGRMRSSGGEIKDPAVPGV